MIEALKIQFLIAGTDFGSSRQRDLGQKWSDTIRGYLGEFGVKLWFKKRWNIDIDLGHEEGTLEEYLPADIHAVKTPADSDFREANLKVSILGCALRNRVLKNLPMLKGKEGING